MTHAFETAAVLGLPPSSSSLATTAGRPGIPTASLTWLGIPTDLSLASMINPISVSTSVTPSQNGRAWVRVRVRVNVRVRKERYGYGQGQG